jgi:MerR family transcriptional regulator, thiopeptide resistance regulator
MVKQRPDPVYRIRQFSRLAGVTVRALHHYDRLGLLKPAARSAAGYRLYTDRDIARLEQIVVFKFLGLSLAQIGRLLKRQSPLADTLRRQQRVLAEKRRHLDAAIGAITRAEQALQSAGEPDWGLFVDIVKEIEMQDNADWSKKYYTPEAQAKVEERKARWNPELQAQVTKDWTELLRDVAAALDQDPAGPTAQALAARWRTLVEGFSGGDPEIQKGLNKMWSDQGNWPADERARFQIDPRIQEFIVNAMRARAR